MVLFSVNADLFIYLFICHYSAFLDFKDVYFPNLENCKCTLPFR